MLQWFFPKQSYHFSPCSPPYVLGVLARALILAPPLAHWERLSARAPGAPSVRQAPHTPPKGSAARTRRSRTPASCSDHLDRPALQRRELLPPQGSPTAARGV